MDAINTLIFNKLVRREGVNLNDIGSLRVVMQPAAMGKKSTLIPPHYRVVFSPEIQPELDSAVGLIRDYIEIDEPGAEKVYSKWVETVRNEERTTIESVGTIRRGHFTPAPGLVRALNPTGTEPVHLTRKANPTQIFLWIIAAILIGGAIALGCIMLLNNQRSIELRPASSSRTSVVRSTENAPTEEALQETPTRPEEAGQTTSGQTGTGQQTPATEASPAQSTAEGPANSAATTQSAPVESTTGSMPTSTGTVSPNGGPMYYVVAGVYSNLENADRFIAKAKAKHPDITFTKMPWVSGKTMVTIFSSTSYTEAEKALNRLSSVEEGMWIFTPKVQAN